MTLNRIRSEQHLSSANNNTSDLASRQNNTEQDGNQADPVQRNETAGRVYH
jgi:hypothetical protein